MAQARGLLADAEATTGDAAVGQRVDAADGLVAGVRRVRERVEEDDHALEHVGLHHHHARHRGYTFPNEENVRLISERAKEIGYNALWKGGCA